MTPESMFFALVSNAARDTLYMGYGQMCPQGKYILIELEAEDELLTILWLGDDFGNGPVIDVSRSFKLKTDLFDPLHHPNKQDWEDLSGFKFVSRLILDPVASLMFLDNLSLQSIEKALAVAEVRARALDDQRAAYDRLSEVHRVRGGLVIAKQQLQSVHHRQSTADALRDKLKKLHGGK